MARQGTRSRSQSKRRPHAGGKRWSAAVTHGSDALDLEEGVFTKERPEDIAQSLAQSAEASDRRRAEPFRSAMSMLTFYINRAGKNLSAEDRRRLEAAKDALRKRYGRPTRGSDLSAGRGRSQRSTNT